MFTVIFYSVLFREARLFMIHSDLNGKVITCKDNKLKMHDANGFDEQLWYEDKHGIVYCKANNLCMSSKSKCLLYTSSSVLKMQNSCC